MFKKRKVARLRQQKSLIAVESKRFCNLREEYKGAVEHIPSEFTAPRELLKEKAETFEAIADALKTEFDHVDMQLKQLSDKYKPQP